MNKLQSIAHPVSVTLSIAYLPVLTARVRDALTPLSHFRRVISEIRKTGHICMCARIHAQVLPIHDLCNMHRYLISKHTPNLVTIGQAIAELQLSGQL